MTGRNTVFIRTRVLTALQVARSNDIARTALLTAVVVGTALNLINQGARWLNGESILVGSLLLNYAIPYFVATFSAARTRLQDTQSRMYPANADD